MRLTTDNRTLRLMDVIQSIYSFASLVRITIEEQSKNYNRIPIQMACLVVPPGRARRVEEELVEQLRRELLRRLRREDAGLEQRRPVGLGRREDLDHAREVRRDLT